MVWTVHTHTQQQHKVSTRRLRVVRGPVWKEVEKRCSVEIGRRGAGEDPRINVKHRRRS